MGDYDTALVCLNGHTINDSFHDYPQFNSKFCKKCGAAGITNCPKCNAFLRGHLRGVLSVHEEPPAPYCYNCGLPYPWTEEALKAANDLIDLSHLADSEKADYKQAILDTTKDTPRARVAVEKLKRYSAKVGKPIADGVKEIITNIAAEAIKKILLP
jgi:hypothetical protein